jgi:hypothetical protein
MSYTIQSGADDIIEYGETVFMDIKLINNMTKPATYVSMSISNDSQYITLIDSTENFGEILPGDSVMVADAFSFDAATFIPNEYPIVLFTTILYDSIIEDKIKLQAYAPIVASGNSVINDGDNGRLDPGDDAVIDLTIENYGGAAAADVEVSLSTNDPYATLDNTSAGFAELIPDQSDMMSFNISVDDQTPVGHVILIAVEVTAANEYSNTDTIAYAVGLVFEDFETGDFSKYPWENDGDNPWTIDDQTVYEGEFSARSGVIDNDQESILMLEMEVLGNGEISFYKKVSCEDDPGGTGYDYLAFSIDGDEQGRWDGDVDWSKETFEVASGKRTFRWVFHKDPFVSEGEDAAWIDFIVFPPVDMPVGIEEAIVSTNNNGVIVFPNPSSRETTIRFQLNGEQDVSLDIFNASGQKVKTLLNHQSVKKGEHSIVWNGSDNSGKIVPEGLYFYRLIAGEQHAGRIVIMR